MPRGFTPPSECPVCGEAVPHGAIACPGCGADERTGWDEDATRYDGLDLPAEVFDEDSASVPKPDAGKGRLWLVVSIVMIAVLILSYVFR